VRDFENHRVRKLGEGNAQNAANDLKTITGCSPSFRRAQRRAPSQIKLTAKSSLGQHKKKQSSSVAAMSSELQQSELESSACVSPAVSMPAAARVVPIVHDHVG
jgi:hypothetical protein